MKKIKTLLVVSSLLLGGIAYAESEVSFDYEANLVRREALEKEAIENYSKQSGMSIQEATKEYYNRLNQKFHKNDEIRKEMEKSNNSN
ncbi:hypothetical protein [uncultured Cetobacterium sp.]|uniref:hypothetical protein n=1 Tax=uncultured Cetobacterium sp. TaxID=527638 RepID=UPI00261DD6EB|nr:hypothetical protein [uncultured Cetobacterium sp.]